MLKYYSLQNRILTRYILRSLRSKERRRFEAENPVSDGQKRLLTFSSVLFTQNKESCRTFKIMSGKDEVREMLGEGWGIGAQKEALSTAKNLANADGHTPFADDVYKTLVPRKRNAPFRLEDLHDMTGIENALRATIARVFRPLEDLYGTAETADLKDAVYDMITETSRAETTLDGLTDEELESFREIVLQKLATRINMGMESYKVAREMLIYLGYSEHELSWIRTVSAWDFGRTGFIARYSVKMGYMGEDEAWGFMQVAADGAVNAYRNWREYLAGYVLGRALGYGDDSKGVCGILRYLLSGGDSPYKEASFSS